jgi:hypothetical protein
LWRWIDPATAVLAGANPMTGLYASFAGPISGGALQSTSVLVDPRLACIRPRIPR